MRLPVPCTRSQATWSERTTRRVCSDSSATTTLLPLASASSSVRRAPLSVCPEVAPPPTNPISKRTVASAMRVLHGFYELHEHPEGALWMDECDLQAEQAGARSGVDQLDAVGREAVEPGLEV